MLQMIMTMTIRTGSSSRWNSIAPASAEKAKPATLDTREAVKIAPAISVPRPPAGMATARMAIQPDTPTSSRPNPAGGSAHQGPGGLSI